MGSGSMGREHIANLRHIDDASIVAIADPNPYSRTHAIQEGRLNGVPEFEDHREMLDAVDLDAVLIATPNDTHVDVLLDVIAADVHVLVEKPLCTTVADCHR
ncbi:MAG: Gfo/Idh/MocA family oxidoreductase, partial [Actinobacteria bacterium]|nr:Gfo/Idh/MocA family oxidoreductase [Actinomycetota bacterium]NIV87326.1 Gfo/Idh/MocA family oxidoreductase [Actinomycetota bacterium]NIX20925.1 Gfo/Idh/MocA family oxidoreductase [Actinomycetota bacterium]